MGNARRETVIAQRLPDLGTWEFYLFALGDSGDTVCKVALRADGAEGVEYGVFRREDGEPSATGVLARSGSWSDEAREDALKEILTIYRSKLPELRGGVLFDLYCERQDDDDDVEVEDAQDAEEGDDDEDDEGWS
jgi:hypothetical protein